MKKVLMILAVLVAALSCFAFTACGETHEEMTGTWAVVYRFVDDDGDKQYSFTTGEYVTITEKTFTYYVADGDGYKPQLETAIKYHYGTSQTSKAVQGSTQLSLRDLNRFSSYKITLEEYGEDTDLGFSFYGDKCMTFGRYGSSSAQYAVLVRCDDVGAAVDGTDLSEITGNWIASGSKLNRTAETLSGYTVSNENGYCVLSADWQKTNSTVNGVTYMSSRAVFTYLYATEDYLIQMVTDEYKTDSGVIYESVDRIGIYFRNDV